MDILGKWFTEYAGKMQFSAEKGANVLELLENQTYQHYFNSKVSKGTWTLSLKLKDEEGNENNMHLQRILPGVLMAKYNQVDDEIKFVKVSPTGQMLLGRWQLQFIGNESVADKPDWKLELGFMEDGTCYNRKGDSTEKRPAVWTLNEETGRIDIKPENNSPIDANVLWLGKDHLIVTFANLSEGRQMVFVRMDDRPKSQQMSGQSIVGNWRLWEVNNERVPAGKAMIGSFLADGTLHQAMGGRARTTYWHFDPATNEIVVTTQDGNKEVLVNLQIADNALVFNEKGKENTIHMRRMGGNAELVGQWQVLNPDGSLNSSMSMEFMADGILYQKGADVVKRGYWLVEEEHNLMVVVREDGPIEELAILAKSSNELSLQGVRSGNTIRLKKV